MPSHRIRLFVAALLFLVAAVTHAEDSKPIRALLVTGGCCHDYDTQKRIIADGLQSRANIEVTVIQQGGTTTDTKIPLYENADWAKGYDIVLHNECFAEVKNEAWTQRVLKPHQNGTPAVVIHCAMHCYRDGTDQWFKFCGVTSHGHGAHYGHEVLNRDAAHPIMKGFGAGWSNPKGELYEIAKLWPTAHPLASAKNRAKGNEEVCVWTNQYGDARVFGTTLGHHNETVSSPEFLDLLTRGTLWACGKLNDQYLKKVDQPTKEQQAEAEAAKTAKLLSDVVVPDGFETTVFATPPAVKYPVFVAAEEDGTLYVAVDQNGSLDRELKRGAVYRLKDIDNDGKADEVKLFVPDVDSPRGMVWDHDRLYVMHPPHLSAFIDEDGDGVSDKQEIIVRDIAFGFADRPADHTSNGVTMGIDGWLYLAIGDFGFMKAVGSDGKTLQLRGGGVVRVRPDGTGLELYSNGTRNILEVAVDPLLNGFTRDNTNDGGGWDIRLHHFTGLEDHGYPRLYMNFGDEIIQPLADYGGGSGCGALYMDEPGFPDGMGNALYTSDWGLQKVFRHTLSPNGATYAPTQDDFVSLPRVTDLDVDANSTIYLSSWKGATFRYVGDEVGYILRMKPKGYTPKPLPDFAKASGEILIGQLKSDSHRRRVAASRSIVRRKLSVAKELESLAGNDEAKMASRVAALFTLKQLHGSDSHVAINQLASAETAIRPFAIRALGDRWDQVDNVELDSLVAGLTAANPRTRLESINAIVRVAMQKPPAGADHPSFTQIAKLLLTESDPVVTHTARQALIRLKAARPCLRLLGKSNDANDRLVLLKVLQSIHMSEVVDALVQLAEKSDRSRREIWTALCRLHFIDGPWKGNSWGTRPDTRGPYYQPEAWEETPKIAAYLKKTLDVAAFDDSMTFVRELARHQIEMDGLVDLLVKASQNSDDALPLLFGQSLDPDSMSSTTKDFLLSLASRTEFPAEYQQAAMPVMLGLGEPKSLDAVVDWVIKDESKRLATGFLRERSLRRNVGRLAELANGDSAASDLALAGLAKISGSSRLDDEQRELVNQTLESKWKSNRRQFLAAARQSRNRKLGDKVKLAMSDDDKEVAALAKKLAKDWNIADTPSLAGPMIKDITPEAALAKAISHSGNVKQGAELFARLQCNKCHTVKPGEALRGPYLPNVAKTYKRNQLAEAVLLPSKSIAQGFVTNVFVLDSGEQIVGFVTNEADLELTVRDNEGKEIKIPVESIEDRSTQKISVMPEGLINEITAEDFGSLVSYLESLGDAK